MSVNIVSGFDHASMVVENTQRSLLFYCGVLGLEQDMTRPDLGYPGAWLNLGVGQIHLLELSNPDPVEGRPSHGGRDRHVALRVTDLDVAVTALEQADIPFSLSKSGRRALFCRDPDANAIELVEVSA